MNGLADGLSHSSTPASGLPRVFSSSFWNFESLDLVTDESSAVLDADRPAHKPTTPPRSHTDYAVSMPPVLSPPSPGVRRAFPASINELTPLSSGQRQQPSTAFVSQLGVLAAPADAEPDSVVPQIPKGCSLFGNGVGSIVEESDLSRGSGVARGINADDVEEDVLVTDSASAQSFRAMSPSGNGEEEELFVDEDDDNEAEQAMRYEFRLAPRVRPLAGGATWLDQDQSGDYDPSQRFPRFSTRLVRRRKRDEQGDEGENADGEDDRVVAKRIRNYYYARQAGDRLVIRLKLSTEEGRAKSKDYDNSIPPGYDENESWNFLLDDEDEQSSEQSSGDSEKPRQLRKRLRQPKGKSDKRCTQDRSQSAPEQHIGLGHPAARGCKACHSLGHVCPMLEPDGTYPCYLCIEDDCDCELLVAPLKKRSCERCRKRRVRCSYVNTKDHAGPCEGCQEAGLRCVAGPAIEAHRTRIGHNGQPATIHEEGPQYKRPLQAQQPITARDIGPQSQGRYLTCVHCRKNGKRCNLRRSKVELPCHLCKMSGAKCSLREQTAGAPAAAWHKARPMQLKSAKRNPTVIECGPGELDDEAAQHFKQLVATSQDESLSQSPLPFPPPRSASLGLGLGLLPSKTPAHFIRRTAAVPEKIVTISTRLLHPLKFNASTCNWCGDPIFGILGIGAEVSMKVRLWPDGKGCTDLSRAASSDISSMCPNCTMERVLVLTCDGHRLRRVRGIAKEVTDITTALEALETSKPGFERKRAEGRLCSICPAVAAFECCTTPEAGTPGETGDSGCGLRFCDTCACLFEELYDRDLNVMVTQIDGADAESYPEGLRADYEFFARNSFLVKQVLDD